MPAARHATLIGGHGFIGRRLHERLARDGWSLWRPRRDDPDLWRRDLGQVFYCAGLTADYAERPAATVEAHASLLGRVLEGARYESLVYLSSTRLYDSLGGVEATETMPLRLDPDDPRHLFDLSKALGESLCRAAGRGRARVARLSCVWSGASDDSGFLSTLIRDALARRTAADPALRQRLQVNSSPRLERDYVHIDDVLAALVSLAGHDGFGIYNVAGGRNVANDELFDVIGAASGCDVIATGWRTPPSLPRISIERMAATFGWAPAATLDQVRRIVAEEASCSSS